MEATYVRAQEGTTGDPVGLLCPGGAECGYRGGDHCLFTFRGQCRIYHYLRDLPWIDLLLNASMILAGMGPVDPLKTDSAKLFASFDALYSGVGFVAIMAILTAPLLHRLLHKFRLEVSEDDRADQDDKPRK